MEENECDSHTSWTNLKRVKWFCFADTLNICYVMPLLPLSASRCAYTHSWELSRLRAQRQKPNRNSEKQFTAGLLVQQALCAH